MTVAIIGSRSIKDIDISEYIPKNTTAVISGGAKGVDTLAEEWSNNNGIPIKIIRPDYQSFGRNAPLIRNRTIVENADIVMAFWNGESGGTSYTIDYAMELGKLVKIYTVKPIV